MKVAFVVQRFGEDIIGGAESHCYQVATHLQKMLNWEVHVFTTTAFSYQTWSDYYPEGEEQIHGLTVFRYKTRINRWPKFFGLYNRIFSPLLQYWGKYPHKIPRIFNPLLSLFEHLWFIFQGPWSPKLIKELVSKKDAYDHIFFFTYLYYPTVYGLSKIKDKCTLIPLAHQEAPLYFPKVRKLLKTSTSLFTNSDVERSLLISKKLSSEERIKTVGCGLDPIYFSKTQFPQLAIPGLHKPYITYLGRISKGKGVSKLIQYFLNYISLSKNEKLTLVLAGENDGSVNISYHPQVKFIGFISQSDKTSLIAHSACVINPSPKESLSLLALEAIALGRPLLVNAKCDVLRYYSEQLNTVFAYSHVSEFNELLSRILHLRKLPDFKLTLLESKKWAQERYSWEKIVSFYNDGVHR